MKKWIKITIIGILSIILVGFLIPQNLKMPVVGADSNDYNHETFWYEGCGEHPSFIRGLTCLPRKNGEIPSFYKFKQLLNFAGYLFFIATL